MYKKYTKRKIMRTTYTMEHTKLGGQESEGKQIEKVYPLSKIGGKLKENGVPKTKGIK